MEYVKEVPTTTTMYDCYNISSICRTENTNNLDVNLDLVVGKRRLTFIRGFIFTNVTFLPTSCFAVLSIIINQIFEIL